MNRMYTLFPFMNEAGTADAGGAPAPAPAAAPSGTLLGGADPAPAAALPPQGSTFSEPTDYGSQTDPAPDPAPTPSTNQSFSAEDWRSSLSQEARDEYGEYLGKYPTLEDAVKGGYNAQKMIGNSIRLPGEDATPEEISKFYNKIGRPEKWEDYPQPEIPTFTDSEGQEVPLFVLDDSWEDTRKEFHSMGLTPQQMQGVMQMYGQQRLNELQQGEGRLEEMQMEMRTQSEKDLMQKWGPQYEVNMSLARKTIEKFGLMDDVKAMGLGNSGALAEMFYEISGHIGEATLTGDYIEGHKSFEEARKELVDHPAYNDKMHPQHDKIRKRLDSLYSKRYPGQEG